MPRLLEAPSPSFLLEVLMYSCKFSAVSNLTSQWYFFFVCYNTGLLHPHITRQVISTLCVHRVICTCGNDSVSVEVLQTMPDWNRQKHRLILALKLFAIYGMFLTYFSEIDMFPVGVFSIRNISLYNFKVDRKVIEMHFMIYVVLSLLAFQSTYLAWLYVMCRANEAIYVVEPQ